MATEFSQPIYSKSMSSQSLMDKMTHSFFAGTIKSEFKEEQPFIDLDDPEFDPMLEQVPSFDQYLMNNITNSPYNSCEFSIAPSLLHSPSSSSLLSSDSLSLSSIASSSSLSASLAPLPSSAVQIVQVSVPKEGILCQPKSFFSIENKPIQFEQSPNAANEITATFITSSLSSTSSSSSSPPPLLLRPQSLSLACFDIKKHDTVSSYLENIDLDENSR